MFVGIPERMQSFRQMAERLLMSPQAGSIVSRSGLQSMLGINDVSQIVRVIPTAVATPAIAR